MKKFVLLCAAGLMLGGAAFAEEENGALGIGLLLEGAESGGNLRGNMFLDVGQKLTGPIYAGFELQGDVKRLGQDQFTVSKTDVTAYDLGGGDFLVFYDSSDWETTLTLWDLDISPRGYLSFDLGNKVQLLGFAGLNYNWQTLDTETTNVGDSSDTIDGETYEPGDTYTSSETVGSGFWSLVAGFRVTVGAFYFDYTRFLDDSDSQVSWNQYTKNRLGAGINLRW